MDLAAQNINVLHPIGIDKDPNTGKFHGFRGLAEAMVHKDRTVIRVPKSRKAKVDPSLLQPASSVRPMGGMDDQQYLNRLKEQASKVIPPKAMKYIGASTDPSKLNQHQQRSITGNRKYKAIQITELLG